MWGKFKRNLKSAELVKDLEKIHFSNDFQPTETQTGLSYTAEKVNKFKKCEQWKGILSVIDGGFSQGFVVYLPPCLPVLVEAKTEGDNCWSNLSSSC